LNFWLAHRTRPLPSIQLIGKSLLDFGRAGAQSHHSPATFLVSKGKDVKTIQGLLRHAKVTTTLDLYSQSIDAAKLEAQEDIALAITSTAAGD